MASHLTQDNNVSPYFVHTGSLSDKKEDEEKEEEDMNKEGQKPHGSSSQDEYVLDEDRPTWASMSRPVVVPLRNFDKDDSLTTNETMGFIGESHKIGLENNELEPSLVATTAESIRMSIMSEALSYVLGDEDITDYDESGHNDQEINTTQEVRTRVSRNQVKHDLDDDDNKELGGERVGIVRDVNEEHRDNSMYFVACPDPESVRVNRFREIEDGKKAETRSEVEAVSYGLNDENCRVDDDLEIQRLSLVNEALSYVLEDEEMNRQEVQGNVLGNRVHHPNDVNQTSGGAGSVNIVWDIDCKNDNQLDADYDAEKHMISLKNEALSYALNDDESLNEDLFRTENDEVAMNREEAHGNESVNRVRDLEDVNNSSGTVTIVWDMDEESGSFNDRIGEVRMCSLHDIEDGKEYSDSARLNDSEYGDILSIDAELQLSSVMSQALSSALSDDLSDNWGEEDEEEISSQELENDSQYPVQDLDYGCEAFVGHPGSMGWDNHEEQKESIEEVVWPGAVRVDGINKDYSEVDDEEDEEVGDFGSIEEGKKLPIHVFEAVSAKVVDEAAEQNREIELRNMQIRVQELEEENRAFRDQPLVEAQLQQEDEARKKPRKIFKVAVVVSIVLIFVSILILMSFST